MQSDTETFLTEMEELEKEGNESENERTSIADSKCSSDSLEIQESDTIISEYAGLYKAMKTPVSQETRRKKLLQDMKSRRNQAVNKHRGLLELLSNDIEDIEDENNELQPEPMDVAVTKYKSRRRSTRKNIYTNQLMMSEWFTEIPCNLESQWLVKLCPVGVRNLIVARNGVTRAFSKKGAQQSKFQSELPGGNIYSRTSRAFTVLDCIYSPILKCYFILDIISWRSTLQLSETEFRFYWLKSKLDETPELRETTVLNEYPFFEIESFPAELPLIQDKLSHPYMLGENVVPLDGILFYHRETHYVSSSTPLVGWLKPFMIPEMLQVPVDEYFMKELPNNYTSFRQYMNTDPKNFKKKNKRNVVDKSFAEAEMEM